MNTTKNNQSLRMVPVDGAWIREDKAEGRRAAKRLGYTINGQLAADVEKRRAELKNDKEKNYTDVEITNIIRAEKLQNMIDMGLGTSHRCSISCPHC